MSTAEYDGLVSIEQDVGRGVALREPLAVVRDWHDESHEGPFKFCTKRPCSDLRDSFRPF